MADGSYTHKCRIGNWSEDYELEQLRMKDYLQRKYNGELLVTKHQAKMNHSLQRVQLSANTDGCVHFGDAVLLYSVKTQGILSNDIGEAVVSSGAKAYTVTTSTLIKHPAARNVYIIEPVQDGHACGDILRFGMPFRLRAHEKLTGSQALYLHSQPVSPLSASKYSRHQEVLLHSLQGSYDTVWRTAHKDKNFRFEMEGEPVPHSVELLITHSQTRQALSSDLTKYENDFGVEYEVCAKTFLVAAKNQTMRHEFLGEITPETASRHELKNNYWAFIVQTEDAPHEQ